MRLCSAGPCSPQLFFRFYVAAPLWRQPFLVIFYVALTSPFEVIPNEPPAYGGRVEVRDLLLLLFM
jgi:hypothetical protein